MRSHSLSMVAAGAALVALLGGCTSANTFPTIKDVQDFAREERATLTAHDTNMTKQHIAQHPEAAEAIMASAAEFRTKMDDIGKRVDKIEGSLKGFLADAVAMFGKLAGINVPLVSLFRDQDNNTDTNAAEIEDLKTWLAKLDAAAEANERQARDRLAVLDKDTQKKFGSADKETSAVLEKLKEDRVAFNQALQDKFQLSNAQMEQFKDMTPQEIMAIIAAALAAIDTDELAAEAGESRDCRWSHDSSAVAIYPAGSPQTAADTGTRETAAMARLSPDYS